ncbi:hypothetical protein ACIRD3_37110 [Kitasatospora sp. NPDC093550]|uniref:hypothetical protein n=1 Tax=Kitasatospora sp. NPDC093550 TaxID=3364089 RepID=UPI003802A86D
MAAPTKPKLAAQRARAGTPATPGGLALLLLAVLLLLGLGGYGVAAQLGDLPYTTRQAGTPGQYTVSHCDHVRPTSTSKPRLLCTGVFRSDDGLTVDPSITIDFQEPDGTRLPMQYDSDGHGHQVGTAAATADLAALGAFVLPLLLAVWAGRALLRAADRARDAGIRSAFGDTMPDTMPDTLGKGIAVAAAGLFGISVVVYLVARILAPVQ